MMDCFLCWKAPTCVTGCWRQAGKMSLNASPTSGLQAFCLRTLDDSYLAKSVHHWSGILVSTIYSMHRVSFTALGLPNRWHDFLLCFRPEKLNNLDDAQQQDASSNYLLLLRVSLYMAELSGHWRHRAEAATRLLAGLVLIFAVDWPCRPDSPRACPPGARMWSSVRRGLRFIC